MPGSRSPSSAPKARSYWCGGFDGGGLFLLLGLVGEAEFLVHLDAELR
jgi:hypothetical protein